MFIIEENKVIEKPKTGDWDGIIIEHITWEVFHNNGEHNKDIFPTGYKVTGVVTVSNGYLTAPNIGTMRTHYFYKHNVLNAIDIGIPYPIKSVTLFYKQ